VSSYALAGLFRGMKCNPSLQNLTSNSRPAIAYDIAVVMTLDSFQAMSPLSDRWHQGRQLGCHHLNFITRLCHPGMCHPGRLLLVQKVRTLSCPFPTSQAALFTSVVMMWRTPKSYVPVPRSPSSPDSTSSGHLLAKRIGVRHLSPAEISREPAGCAPWRTERAEDRWGLFIIIFQPG
jgi:hypothetical protein